MNKKIQELEELFDQACECPDADHNLLHRVFWESRLLRDETLTEDQINAIADKIKADIMQSLKGCDL